MTTRALTRSFLACLVLLLGSGLEQLEAAQRQPLVPDAPGAESPSAKQAAVQAKLHLGGRVTHRGLPLPDAQVTLCDPPLPEGQPPRLPWVKRRGRTDSEGRFRLRTERPRDNLGVLVPEHEYLLSVWHKDLGEGESGLLRIDLEQPAQDLELEITRAPGHIRGV